MMVPTFPSELLVQIILQLDLLDKNTISNLAKTCKRFNLVLTEFPYLWTLISIKYGLNTPETKPYYQKFLQELNIWDVNKTSEFISISGNGKVATRLCNGVNSSVLAKHPLKQGVPVSIKLISIVKWISLGLATSDFKVEGSPVVGEQNKKRPNLGLYIHPPVIRLHYSAFADSFVCSEQHLEFSYKKDDVITLKRQDSNLLIHLNDKLISKCTNFPNDLDFYPCVSLSHGSSVELI